MKEKTEELDKYEFYSFTIYLYAYGLFYLFIFEQTLIRAIFFHFFINFILYYSINHHILKFFSHKYWKTNLKDIVMPQLIVCSSTLITYKYEYYISIPINVMINYMIYRIYKKELRYSKNLRYIILILLLFSRFIF